MARVHGENRLRQFPLALATALKTSPTARREPVGNATCACYFTLPREVLTLSIVADVLLPSELFLARRTRQQPLQPLRLIDDPFRGYV
eukprot:4298374-Pyramimonas_sp.AAC.1